jgi:hypothetical protein
VVDRGCVSDRRSERAQQVLPDTVDLTGFPTVTTLQSTWLREHGDRPGKADHGCWWFSGHDHDHEPGGRFDLLATDGTCYLGETAGVAVRERCGRLLAAHMPIPATHLEGRVVSTVRLPELEGRVADLTNPDAALFGVTGELAAGTDYNLSSAWARALHSAGMLGGIYYLARFTPGQEFALGVFGPGGDHDWGIVGDPVSLIHALASIGYRPGRSAIPSNAAVAVDDAAEPDAAD